MTVPAWVKPGIWGGVIGVVAIMIVGFSAMGWTTAGSANRMASERADAAVVAALVPFCIENAEHDGDATKLVKLNTESSSWTRSQLVSNSGWATMPGMTSPNGDLATACAAKLQAPKV